MTKLIVAFALILGFALPAAAADTHTSRLNLTLPEIGSSGWGVKVSSNFIDISTKVFSLGDYNLVASSADFNGGRYSFLYGFQASSAAFGSGATKSTFTTTGDLNLATNADITLTGPTAYATFPASVTASSYYGWGANLGGIPSTGSIVGVYAPLAGATFTGASGITNAAFTATGANGNIVTAASSTASAFFGDVSHTTGFPYDIAAQFPTAPTARQEMIKIVMVRPVTFPAAFTLSQATASVKATAYAEFSIRKNNTEIGAFYYSTNGTSATFKGAGGTFAAGDILTVISSGTVDATLSGGSFNLGGSQ